MHVDDETAVRKNAQDLLNRLENKGKFVSRCKVQLQSGARLQRF